MKENRINEKIKEIEKYLEELESLFPIDYKKYIEDFKIKAICERYFEKIVESSVDLAFLVIKEKGFTTPEDDKNSFDILEKEGIISKELANRLKDAKGMRNIIAHDYGKVDDELVFYAVTEELKNDIEEFIKNINSFLRK